MKTSKFTKNSFAYLRTTPNWRIEFLTAFRRLVVCGRYRKKVLCKHICRKVNLSTGYTVTDSRALYPPAPILPSGPPPHPPPPPSHTSTSTHAKNTITVCNIGRCLHGNTTNNMAEIFNCMAMVVREQETPYRSLLAAWQLLEDRQRALHAFLTRTKVACMDSDWSTSAHSHSHRQI